MTTPGYVYQNKGSETPFETFLRYSDQKEKSASKLATILRTALGRSSSVLDVGTGNGEYLKLALSHLDQEVASAITLTLIEPSNDLVGQLAGVFSAHRVAIINSDLQSFESDSGYDVILMSHLFYHIPRSDRAKELTKALSLLKSGGVLIIVLRGKDDAYDFKMTFMPQLSDTFSQSLTLDSVLEDLPEATDLSVQKQSSLSELHIPTHTSPEDTESIIEFYLDQEWAAIPASIQQAVLDFIEQKNNLFRQVDEIAVVSKNTLHSE
jgi:cyclopropane fatty-acyl-phospholipid synthase-like methyltransferase